MKQLLNETKKEIFLVSQATMVPDPSDFLKSTSDHDWEFVSSISPDELLCYRFCYSFAKLLKEKRKELHWTQNDLAQKSNVNRVTISKIERFQQTASIDIVLKLLHPFNLTLGFSRSDPFVESETIV